MKPATTLKELLKPPFEDSFETGDIYCNIRTSSKNYHAYILDIRANFFQYHFKDSQSLHDELKAFVIDALNEKWERDYSDSRTCPYCSRKKDSQLFCRGQEMNIEYCPFCGRLLPHE